MANTVDENRVADIANAIRAQCLALSDPADRAFAHEDALNAEREGMNQTRVAVVQAVAALSLAQSWTVAEIKAACAKAAKSNDESRSAKTVAVFISEMKTFASPKVRANLPTIVDTCQKAWDDEAAAMADCETKAEKDALDTPVHKYKGRFYHLIMAIARAHKDDELLVHDADDVITWAAAHDPDHDEDRVAARLETIIASLTKMFEDFGLADIHTAAEYLGTVTAKDLLAARGTMLARRAAQDAARLAGHKLTPIPPPIVAAQPAVAPAPVAAVVAEPIVNANPPIPAEPIGEAVVEGAYDIDLTMNDEVAQTNDRAVAQLAALQLAA